MHYTGESIASGTDEEKHAASTSSLTSIASLCAPALSFAAIAVHAGRPDLDKRIKEMMGLTIGGGKIVVAACGPESLCDSSRVAVRGCLGEGEGKLSSDLLHYEEESFTW